MPVGPITFQRKILRRKLWSKQEDLLRAVMANRSVSVKGSHASGKFLNYSTVIETPTGPRRWGDMRVGDEVFGQNGLPTTVIARHEQGVQPIYRVEFDDGSAAMCGLDHLWNVRGRTERYKGIKTWRTLTTKQLLEIGLTFANGVARGRQWEIPTQGPAEFDSREIDLHPYLVGIWLGDGTVGLPCYTKPYEEVADRLRSFGYTISQSGTCRRLLGVAHLFSHPVFKCKSPDRYIPEDYKYNTPENRRELLRGILDSDGEVSHRAITYSSTSKQLIDGVVWLVRSIGGKATLQEAVKQSFYYGKNGERIEGKPCWRCSINLDWNPFTVKHKAERWRLSQDRYRTRWIESIEYSHDEEAMCITVDRDDGLYLANDFIVTHNSFCCAGLVPYFLMANSEAIVLVIAPTLRQVKTFWIEIASALERLPFPHPEPTTTGWSLGPKCYAQGFSSSKGVNAQGFHGRKVLILADEAVGISSDIWDAIEGVRSAGDVKIVKLCNPTVPSGPVYDDFTKNRSIPGHCAITINAFDSPNLAGLTMESLMELSEEDLDISAVPHLIRRRWVKEMAIKWGPKHPKFIARVLGEFPSSDPNQVFDHAWIARAGRDPTEKELKDALGGQIRVALDVAGPGNDNSALCARVRGIILRQESWHVPDVLPPVLRSLGELRADRRWGGIECVVVDVAGLGYHLAPRIAAAGFPVAGFNAGWGPMEPLSFVNSKAEAHFTAREWFRQDLVSQMTDEDCSGQLSTILWKENPGGKSEIESKEERNRRGIPGSPDEAEALVMCFHRLVPQHQESTPCAPVRISPV